MDDETPNEVIHLPRHTGEFASKKVPAAIQKLILELGLRYRPLGQADQDAYRQKLALLANDCADIPADILAKAIERYVKIPSSSFLPKAGQLIEIAQQFSRRSSGSVNQHGQPMDLDGYADWLNKRNFSLELGWQYYVATDDEGRRTLEKRQLEWEPEERRWVMPKPKPAAH